MNEQQVHEKRMKELMQKHPTWTRADAERKLRQSGMAFIKYALKHPGEAVIAVHREDEIPETSEE